MENDKQLLCQIYREVGTYEFTVQAVDHIPGISEDVLCRMANTGLIRKVRTVQPSGMPEYRIPNHQIALCACSTGIREEMKV